MTSFFKKPKKLDVYETTILDTLEKAGRYLTPAEVASYLGIHQKTAQSRMLRLRRKHLIKCVFSGEGKGKRLYCKIK